MFPNSMKMFETENNSVLAVNDVSFQIPHGSFVGIMGASGSGKTTLLNLIATIDKPTNGMIRIRVTHDVMAASYCDRILFMKDGEIKTSLNREQESKQTFFADILKKIEWIEGESHDVLEVVNP